MQGEDGTQSMEEAAQLRQVDVVGTLFANVVKQSAEPAGAEKPIRPAQATSRYSLTSPARYVAATKLRWIGIDDP